MSLAFHPMSARAVACGAFLVLSMTATAQDSLEIATLDNSAMGPLAIAVLRQAYGKLGVDLKTRVLPLRRGVQMADRGEIDGDLLHSLPSLKEWDNLIVVRVPVARAVFVAYMVGDTCPPAIARSELATARVAYMRGTRAVEDVVPTQALLATTNNLDALRHVQRGIAQYAVIGQLEGDALVAKHQWRHLCKVSEPVASADLFHSLNKRHGQLAERLELVLQEMSDSGEIRRIWSREIQRVRAGLQQAGE